MAASRIECEFSGSTAVVALLQVVKSTAALTGGHHGNKCINMKLDASI